MSTCLLTDVIHESRDHTSSSSTHFKSFLVTLVPLRTHNKHSTWKAGLSPSASHAGVCSQMVKKSRRPESTCPRQRPQKGQVLTNFQSQVTVTNGVGRASEWMIRKQNGCLRASAVVPGLVPCTLPRGQDPVSPQTPPSSSGSCQWGRPGQETA